MNHCISPLFVTTLTLILTTIGGPAAIAQTTAQADHPAVPLARPKASPMPSLTPLTTPPAKPPIVPHDHDAHSVAIPAGQAVPTIKLVILPDAVAGWNMEIQLTQFRFNPAQVNQSSKTTEGHAHLLLNDRKVARIYGTWNHIPKLPQGKNVLKVVLMTNQHEALTQNGQPIVGSAIIEVP